MLVFGVLVVWSAWRAMRGERGMLFVACAIGVFYLAVGVLSLAYMHEPFWGVFVVLGGLTLVLSALLGLAPSKRQVPPTRDQARA